MAKQPKLSESELKKLGENLVSIYEIGYEGRKQLFKYSFVKGVMAGFGGVLGATILVALLLWGLSLFDDIPLLGRVAEKLYNAVQSSQ